MPNIQKSLDKFNNLELEIVLTVDGDETVRNLEMAAQRNNIETGPLSVALIFLAAEDLSLEGVPGYLEERLETSALTAKKIAADFIESVVNPLRTRLEFLNSNPAKKMTAAEEKNILLEMFARNLLVELKNSPIILNAINHQIFYVLAGDLKFHDELVKILLSNEEILTGGTVLVGGKSVRPTIFNWLKNFIEINGSAIFDSVVLSGYLASSKNMAGLSPEDKERISKILALYRNLKFFPESMPNDTGENWQILPFPLPEEISGGEVAEKEKLSVPENYIPVPEKKPEVEDSGLKEEEAALAKFDAEIQKYPQNSLQRRALEAERSKAVKPAVKK
jgi:hypothetical protein